MGKALIITTGGGTDIEEGNPNAIPRYVLSGYTFYAMQDDPQTGAMPTHYPEYTHQMDPSWTLDLPEGYYTGKLVCEAKPLSSFTDGTANSDHITWGWTGWRKGSQVSGTMLWIGSGGGVQLWANGTHTIAKGQHDGGGSVWQSLWTWGWGVITPNAWTQTVVDNGVWTTGDRIVAGDGNLAPWNIKKGINIFGVVGTYEFTGWTGPTDWIAANDVLRVEYSGNYTYRGWVRFIICNIPFAGLWPCYGEINIGSGYDSKMWGIVLGPDANKYPDWIISPSPCRDYIKNFLDWTKVEGSSYSGVRFKPVVYRPLGEPLVGANQYDISFDIETLNSGYTHREHTLDDKNQQGYSMNNWRSAGKNQGGRLALMPNNPNDYISKSWSDVFMYYNNRLGIPNTHIRMIYCYALPEHETRVSLPDPFSMRFVPGVCPMY